ncbi:hypothetical protein [Azotobacter salinestris]|uniref:hypothetical protein n=1 Tax=Azotobacter salinestris TaxID=69964 RepID=UPI0012669D2D|nr:hypothetical protein [Azotobacter salinestris]
MSEFKAGQAVKFTNPRQQVKTGTYRGEINTGIGRGQGIYAQVEVDGKILKVRPSRLSAA